MKENRIVVADLNWAETVPEWLKEEVKSERLIFGLRSILKPIEEVGDAEVCLYLYTAGLRQPLTYELTEVYVYLVAKLLKKRGKEISEEMKEKLERGLTAEEERQLRELKEKLYWLRGGEISHPILDSLRSLKKTENRKKKRHKRKLSLCLL